jgi:hypothetical protein
MGLEVIMLLVLLKRGLVLSVRMMIRDDDDDDDDDVYRITAIRI